MYRFRVRILSLFVDVTPSLFHAFVVMVDLVEPLLLSTYQPVTGDRNRQGDDQKKETDLVKETMLHRLAHS